jgi:hypothetical protein
MKQVMSKLGTKKVIYVQDGKYVEENQTIYGYFDSIHVRIDSAFFPQTINVFVYDLKDK